MIFTCSNPMSPRSCPAAVFDNSGASGSPVIEVRGPRSLASLIRRLASSREIRSNVANAAATEDSPNSSAGTSTRPFTSRCCRAGSWRTSTSNSAVAAARSAADPSTDSAIAASSSARMAAMRFNTATELILRTVVRSTDIPPASCDKLSRSGGSYSALVAGAVEQLRGAQHPLDPDLDHDPARIDPRGPVALRVAEFGIPDGLGVGVDRRPALQRQPTGAVDLAEDGDAAMFGVDRLLRAAAGDHPGDVGLRIEGEPDRDDVRRVVRTQCRQHREMALGHERQRVV